MLRPIQRNQSTGEWRSSATVPEASRRCLVVEPQAFDREQPGIDDPLRQHTADGPQLGAALAAEGDPGVGGQPVGEVLDACPLGTTGFGEGTGDVDEAYLNKIEQARNDASKNKVNVVSAIIDLYNN